MHWDVVEVAPKPERKLLVRFKDGTESVVELREEQLTGVLAPLLDEEFFQKVFIDNGAVAWPGEIDLAPDAMYAAANRRSGAHSLTCCRKLAPDAMYAAANRSKERWLSIE